MLLPHPVAEPGPHPSPLDDPEPVMPNPHTPDLETDLDSGEIRRYGRHLVLPEIGLGGQKRLKAARVLLVGVGGLGSPSAQYLAAAGVGTLGLVDFDRVEESNLQRQVLFGQATVGAAKVEAARERLLDLNPRIRVQAVEERLGADNAMDLLSGYDLVIDGSDNFTTRYLVNDACVIAGRPVIWGAVAKFEGQVSVFAAEGGPCYRCLFPEPPPPGLVPSCAEGGVLGVLPGIIGALQASEALKLILGLGEPLVGRLVIFDALGGGFREVSVQPAPDCPMCGVEPGRRELVEVLGGPCLGIEPERRSGDRDELPSPTKENDLEDETLPFDIEVQELKRWLDEGREIHILDVREPQELEICRIEGAKHIPLRDLPARFDELDEDVVTVVHCHHGPRSSHAVQFLRDQGLEKTVNLAGGIDAWSFEIDRDVPRY